MDKEVSQAANLPAQKELAKIPGAVRETKFDAWWVLVAIVILLVIFLALVFPDPYLDLLRFVRRGLIVTITITFISFFLTLILGLFGGLARVSKNFILNGISTLYVEIIRGIPLLVQLIWWFFAFPALIRSFGAARGIPALANYVANEWLMAVVGLTICYGAYMSEIYRAGIQSIPVGQMEAARSLGMTYFQAMRFVIIPQAVRVILPPVGNEFTALLKDTSLVSVIAVSDLTRAGREFMSTHYNPTETWNMVALLYLILTLFSSRVNAFIERRLSVTQR